MSWKTNAYLEQLRHMDGQQADTSVTEPAEETTTETPMLPHRSQPVHPNQQPLFAGVAK
jgi:hypothetical protein